MKRLMILGGANSQTPAVRRAKELGYYVITCDYLPENPGHKFSDRYINVSTTDREAVLRLAREAEIGGILAYASDPAAETEAYVCDKLGLPGNRFEAVKIFAEKDCFREFQRDNGFLTPHFVCASGMAELERVKGDVEYPCFIKPVDSSGSKGISRLDSERELRKGAERAFGYSRCGRIIVEQVIESPYCQLHGDGFVMGGKLIFAGLGDQRFRACVPIGSSLPSCLRQDTVDRAVRETERLIECGGLTQGAVNIEARVTAGGEIYLLEVGPRAGGNYVPQLMEAATGFDELTACLKAAVGEPVCIPSTGHETRFCFQYIIGSEKAGHFERLELDDYIKSRLLTLYIHKRRGEEVRDYVNSAGVAGVALLQFTDREDMERGIREIKEHIRVITR